MVSNRGETISAVVAWSSSVPRSRPGFLQQHQHLEQVADAFGVRDDAVAQRLAAEAAQHLGCGLEDRQLVPARLAVRVVALARADAQRPRVVEHAQQQLAPRRLGERRVVGLDARHLEQLGDDGLVLVRALAQVDGREVEAEHLHRAHQRRQARPHQRLGVMRDQRGLDRAQVGEQLGRCGIRRARRDRVAQRLGAGENVQRRRQARVDADQGAPVRLVLAVRTGVAGGIGERLHLRRDRLQRRRIGELGAELVDLRQVVAQHGLALAHERGLQRRRADERVAVAIAADPVAHAEEAGDVVARQRLLDLAVEDRDLRQEGRAVVAERVLDLVVDGELGGAQHPRLPELGDAGADQRLVVGELALARLRRSRRQQLGDRALGVEDALPLHLGRMRGQHRRDEGMVQRRHDLLAGDAAPRQPLERQRQRALLQMALALVDAAPAQVVPVLGDVGEVREVAEGADHAHRVVAAQAHQQPVERLAGALVALPAGRRRRAGGCARRARRRPCPPARG